MLRDESTFEKYNTRLKAIIIFCAIVAIIFAYSLPYGVEKYTLDNEIPCKDNYNNIIKDAVCYETIECHPTFTFLNQKECDEVLLDE